MKNRQGTTLADLLNQIATYDTDPGHTACTDAAHPGPGTLLTRSPGMLLDASDPDIGLLHSLCTPTALRCSGTCLVGNRGTPAARCCLPARTGTCQQHKEYTRCCLPRSGVLLVHMPGTKLTPAAKDSHLCRTCQQDKRCRSSGPADPDNGPGRNGDTPRKPFRSLGRFGTCPQDKVRMLYCPLRAGTARGCKPGTRADLASFGTALRGNFCTRCSRQMMLVHLHL